MTTTTAPTLENGADTPEAPGYQAPETPVAPDRPRTKTGACRQLLREGLAPEAVKIDARDRWGFEVNANDLANAKKANEEEDQRRKAERMRKRKEKVSATQPYDVALRHGGDKATLEGMCAALGIAEVRRMLDAIETDAKLKLGIK